MRIYRIRYLVQIVFFFIIIYGAYFGIRFKTFLPMLGCTNTSHYSRSCYMLPLQNFQNGINISPDGLNIMPFPGYAIIWGQARAYLWFFLSIVIFVLVSNKLWCGWICPFGTFQDGVNFLRRKLKLRETRFSESTKNNFRSVKYIFLVLFLGLLAGQAFGFRADMPPIYCNICPVRPFLSIFEGSLLNFGIGYPPGIFFSIITCIFAGVVFIGMFLKERFFCNFCPVIAFFNCFSRLSMLKLKKNVNSCNSCGNCWRVCPMDIKENYSEKKNENLLSENCILCLRCIEVCPQDNTRSLSWFKKNILASSKRYFAGFLKK